MMKMEKPPSVRNPLSTSSKPLDVLHLVDKKVLRPRDSKQGLDEGLELFWSLDRSVPVSVKVEKKRRCALHRHLRPSALRRCTA